MPHEIITLQLGQFANFVGTHWWNIQESAFSYESGTEPSEVDPDVTFREGETKRGDVTFTPRLVLVDLKQNLASLPAHGTLYEENGTVDAEEAHFTWDEEIDFHQTKPAKKNAFLQDLQNDQLYVSNGLTNGHKKDIPKTYSLEKEAQTWSDFKKIHYHPKSTVLIDSNPMDLDKFESFDCGLNEVKFGGILPNVEESLRYFAEECDTIQGFHMLCDMHNAFGGIASGVMEYLNDEFKGKTLAAFPLLPQLSSTSATKLRMNCISKVLTVSSLLDLSSYTVPVSLCCDLFKKHSRKFPHLVYDASIHYHTSAIIASALETMSQPYKSRQRHSSIADIAIKMTAGSRKLLGLNSAFPLPFDTMDHLTLPDFLMDYADTNFWQALTPNLENEGQYFSQNIHVNGLNQTDFRPTDTSLSGLHQCIDPNSMLKLYMKERFRVDDCDVTASKDALKVSVPFPQFFTPDVNSNGRIKKQVKDVKYSDQYTEFLLNGGAPTHSKRVLTHGPYVEEVPVMTMLEASSALGSLLKRCHTQGTKLQKWYAYSQPDREIEFVEHLEQLKSIETDYKVLTDFDDSDSSG